MIEGYLEDMIMERKVGVSLQEIQNLYTVMTWQVYLRLLQEDRRETVPSDLVEAAERYVIAFNEWDQQRNLAD
jgi:ABC-type anion transport system duplicated permease subunit